MKVSLKKCKIAKFPSIFVVNSKNFLRNFQMNINVVWKIIYCPPAAENIFKLGMWLSCNCHCPSIILYWFGSSFKFSFSIYAQLLAMKVNKSNIMAARPPVYISMLTTHTHSLSLTLPLHHVYSQFDNDLDMIEDWIGNTNLANILLQGEVKVHH